MDHGHFVSQYVAGQQDKLSALSSAIMEENANQQSAMQKHQDAMASVVENQLDLTRHLHESFLSDVSSLMERMMDRQRQELDTHMGKVSQDLKTSSESQQAHADKLHRTVSSLTSDVCSFGQSCMQAVLGTTEMLDTMLAKNETTGSEQEKTKDELKTTLAEGIASIGQVCK